MYDHHHGQIHPGHFVTVRGILGLDLHSANSRLRCQTKAMPPLDHGVSGKPHSDLASGSLSSASCRVARRETESSVRASIQRPSASLRRRRRRRGGAAASLCRLSHASVEKCAHELADTQAAKKVFNQEVRQLVQFVPFLSRLTCARAMLAVKIGRLQA